jgi:hypothetical protein
MAKRKPAIRAGFRGSERAAGPEVSVEVGTLARLLYTDGPRPGRAVRGLLEKP